MLLDELLGLIWGLVPALVVGVLAFWGMILGL